MKFIIKIVVNALVLIALAGMFPHTVFVESFGIALLTGMFIAILNNTIRPILQIFALPISIFTFGIFALIINGFVLELAINLVGSQIQINGFFYVMLVSIILSFVQSAVFKFLNQNLHRPL